LSSAVRCATLEHVDAEVTKDATWRDTINLTTPVHTWHFCSRVARTTTRTQRGERREDGACGSGRGVGLRTRTTLQVYLTITPAAPLHTHTCTLFPSLLSPILDGIPVTQHHAVLHAIHTAIRPTRHKMGTCGVCAAGRAMVCTHVAGVATIPPLLSSLPPLPALPDGTWARACWRMGRGARACWRIRVVCTCVRTVTSSAHRFGPRTVRSTMCVSQRK